VLESQAKNKLGLMGNGFVHPTNSSNKMAKTYNSGYSLVVTHLTTNPPVRCLNRAERTGSLVFNVLWSYVEGIAIILIYIDDVKQADRR
jgi:hypothetical protein